MRLDKYDSGHFDRGRKRFMEALWLLLQALFVHSWIPGSRHRVSLLRWFGAAIGEGVVVKPRVHVTFPWRLRVGDHTWIGEGCWIDNLAPVNLGSNVCVSQDCYLCTGNHDWTSEAFELIVKPIDVQDQSWLGARSVVGPGVTVARRSIVALGSVVSADTAPNGIYRGNPAARIKDRRP